MVSKGNLVGAKVYWWMAALLIVGFLLGLGVRSVFGPAGDSQPKVTVTQMTWPTNKVTALGRIQPFNGLITVGLPLPDRIRELLVEEGSQVKDAEVVLAILASEAERKLELELLGQQLKEAEDKIQLARQSGIDQLKLDKLRLEQAQQLGPLDLAMQKIKVAVLQEQAQQARGKLAKMKKLRGSALSEEEFQHQEVMALQVAKEFEAAQAQEQKLIKSQNLEQQLYRYQYALAETVQKQTESQLSLATLTKQKELAEARWQRTFIRAPGKGTVLKIFCRPGELAGGQQPLLQMADTDKMAVLAEVHEHDIHRVKIGAKARIIRSAASVENLEGKVTHVGGMIAKNRVFAADPTADVDLRVLEVKILLDNALPAAGLTNHQVTVEIQQ